MRKRPWEIMVLTFIYLLAPLGNLAYTVLSHKGSLYVLTYLQPLDWGTLMVYPVLAAAVFSVSLVGWWAFLGLNLLLLSLNLYQGSLSPGANLWLVAGADMLNLAVASLLFTKHARSPYFSPRMRWWETPTRYQVGRVLDVPLSVRQDGQEGQGLILDVSSTGCFADLPPGLLLDEPVDLEFACWGLTIHSQGRILRHSGPNEPVQGYGVQFLGLTKDQKHHLNSLVKVLKAHRVPPRDSGPPVPAVNG